MWLVAEFAAQTGISDPCTATVFLLTCDQAFSFEREKEKFPHLKDQSVQFIRDHQRQDDLGEGRTGVFL